MMNPIAKTNLPTKILLGLLLVMSLSACKGKKSEVKTAEVPHSMATEQTVLATLWYQRSMERNLLCEQAYARANELLVRNLQMAPKNGKRPAIIMDLDETVLDNSRYQAHLIQNGLEYSEESWSEWVSSRNASLIPGAVSFIERCLNSGVEVFYVSNRSVRDLEATFENLAMLEVPGVDPGKLLLKEDNSDKTERRELIKREFNVILSIGDQLGDFVQLEGDFYAEGNPVFPAELQDSVRRYFVLLPNPMYGEFDRNTPVQNAGSKAANRKASLYGF